MYMRVQSYGHYKMGTWYWVDADEERRAALAIGKSILRHRRKLAKRLRYYDWWGLYTEKTERKTWPPRDWAPYDSMREG